MRKEFGDCEPAELVLGLHNYQDVAIVGGNPAFFGWIRAKGQFVKDQYRRYRLKKNVNSVTGASKASEANAIVKLGHLYDRVLVTADVIDDEFFLAKAASLVKIPSGLLCLPTEGDEQLLARFLDVLDRNYPRARRWVAESAIGPIVMAETYGVPDWAAH